MRPDDCLIVFKVLMLVDDTDWEHFLAFFFYKKYTQWAVSHQKGFMAAKFMDNNSKIMYNNSKIMLIFWKKIYLMA